MATFSLDDIRSAAEAKYGSTDIQVGEKTVRLLNPLRLGKKDRDALMALQEQMGKEDSDTEEILHDVIRLVAESDSQAEALLEAVGDDLGVLMEIFTRYNEGTQLGEASASQE